MFSTSRNRLHNKKNKGIIGDTLDISRTFFHPFCNQFSLLLYRAFQVFDNLVFQGLEGNGVDNKTHNNERQECQYQEKNTEFTFCRFEQYVTPLLFFSNTFISPQRRKERKEGKQGLRRWEVVRMRKSHPHNFSTSQLHTLHAFAVTIIIYFFGTFSQSARNRLTPSSVSGC